MPVLAPQGRGRRLHAVEHDERLAAHAIATLCGDVEYAAVRREQRVEDSAQVCRRQQRP